MNRINLADAQANREYALALVEAHAAPDWYDVALRAVGWVAMRQLTFISDDIWDALNLHYPDVKTHENRAMGPVLRRAVAEGFCRPDRCSECDSVKTRTGRRNQGNATPQPIYQSLIYDIEELE